MRKFRKKMKQRRPAKGQLELTYRCDFKCPYCYVRPYQKMDYYKKELSFEFWKHILDVLHNEGCMNLTFTGGDPLLREDFIDLYLYAKRKGFIISVFTNAVSLEGDVVEVFKKYYPYSIEITLNSLKEERFDIITGTRGNLQRCISNIEDAVRAGLPIVLKSNGLKINKDEISQIKAFAGKLLGENKFKFDSYITSMLDGDKAPLNYRLSPEEIIELEESDYEIKEFLKEGYNKSINYEFDKELLYKCNTWLTNFFIDPYGILRFCHLSNKYSTDLKKLSFQEGFYNVFPQLAKEGYKTDTECKYCELAERCMSCPARNFLEIGDEEKPVPYFCQLAKARAAQKERLTTKI